MNFGNSDAYEVVKIVSCDESGRLSFNTEGFKSVISKIPNIPIVIISVAGKCRIGKSFLINSLIPVLEHYEKHGNLSGFNKDNIDFHMHGFRFDSRRDYVTKGIDLLDKPFVISNPKNSNEKMAVLLMDCQGLDSIETDGGVDKVLFCITNFLSSHVIFNIDGRSIKTKELSSLISLAGHSKNHNKDTFSSLDIVIRDYKYRTTDIYEMKKEFKNYVDDMCIKSGSILKGNLKELEDYFRFVKCYPLPDPGRSVERKSYDGDISKINPKFVDIFYDYIYLLFDKEHLKPKFEDNEQLLEMFEMLCKNTVDVDMLYRIISENRGKEKINNFIDKYLNPLKNSCYNMNEFQLKEKIKDVKCEYEKVKDSLNNKSRMNDFYIDYEISYIESQYRIKKEKEQFEEEERRKQKDIEHELVLMQRVMLIRKDDQIKQKDETLRLLQGLVEEQRRTIAIQQDLIIQQNNRK